jgi:hypothetical protein
MADVSTYTELVTAEHADKPKFMAMVSAVAGCFVNAQNFVESMPVAFDLDTAVGSQLDILGLWIGVSRRIKVPVANVYFSWDTDGVGWDQGVWLQNGDAMSTISELDDDTYRLVLRAKIGANNWNGSTIDAAPILSEIFGDSGTYSQISDNGDMSFDVYINGPEPSALKMALISGGYIPIKPAGVKVNFGIGLTLDGSVALDGSKSLTGIA